HRLRHDGSSTRAIQQRRRGSQSRGRVHSGHGRERIVSSVATMARALLYLRVTSLLGQVKSRLRRLQQPKYLAGALVGAAYVYLTFLRRAHGVHTAYRPGPPGPGLPAQAFSILPELVALMLLLSFAVNWLAPRRAALAFSEAEIAFL